jgi:hypothetical protein
VANFPSIITYGTVVGQFVQSVVDSADPGREPDMVGCSGTLSFRPDRARMPLLEVVPNPMTVSNNAIPASLDVEGYVIDNNLLRGVTLLSSDAIDATYTVTINLTGLSPISFSFWLPAGGEIDLTTVAPIPSDPGTELAAWQAAVAQTQAAAAAAISAQLAVEAALGASEDIPSLTLLFENGLV